MRNTVEKTACNGNSPATVKSQYIRLLTGFAPVVIESDTEHERALKAARTLMEKVKRSRAETSLLKLLAVLIEDYEQDRFSMGNASPLESLRELMRVREISPKDLWVVFGSKGIASEVLNGKRRISNATAVKLGEMFHVPPAVFIAAPDLPSEFARQPE